MITPNQAAKASDFVIVAVAGEALSAREAVYISSTDGKAYKCDADDLTKIGFAGFVETTATLNGVVYIRTAGIMGGFSSLTVNADYYLSGTAGAVTATKPSNFKIVGRAVTATCIRITTEPTKRVRTYTTTPTIIGSSTTQFDITNPSGTTFRYTYDATGTDPSLSLANNPVGSAIYFHAQNFSAANNGAFVVTGAGANYVEVTNASGVVESNKTVGTGYIAKGTSASVWTKPGGFVRATVQVQGDGGGGGDQNDSDSNTEGADGGPAGGYAIKDYEAADITASSVAIEVPAAESGRYAMFGPSLYAVGSGGTASGGDINIAGVSGHLGSNTGQGGSGASSILGLGGQGNQGNGGNGADGTGYGSGGGGAGATGVPTQLGGNGTQGVVIVTEFY